MINKRGINVVLFVTSLLLNCSNARSAEQGPYGGVAWSIPGLFEAEDYDVGGSTVSYYDTTSGNYGAVYRDARVGMKENDVQGIMIKAIYEAGGEYEEGWVVNAGDRTNPRSFNWSDRPLRPREFLSLEAEA